MLTGNKMENAEQIHVFKSNPLEDPDICYKPEIYKSKGWCKLAVGSNAWGICSPSCKYFVSLGFTYDKALPYDKPYAIIPYHNLMIKYYNTMMILKNYHLM